MNDDARAIELMKREREQMTPAQLFGVVLVDFHSQEVEFLQLAHDTKERELTFEEWKALDHCLQLYGHYAEVGQSTEWPEHCGGVYRKNAKRMGEIVAGYMSIVAGMFCDVKDCKTHAADTYTIKTPTTSAVGFQVYAAGALPKTLTVNLCADHAPVLPHGNEVEARWIVHQLDTDKLVDVAIENMKGAE